MSDHRLPDGWQWSVLGRHVEIVRGVAYKKQDARDAPGPRLLPLLRATNIAERLTFDDLVFVPEECVSEEQYVRPGDIVVAASSGSRSVVGKAAPVLEPWRGAFGAFCLVVRPSPQISPRYVSYFMASSEYRSRVSSLAAGVNINNLRQHHITETPFPLAPPVEQARIVAEVDKQFTRLDTGVATLKRLQAHLRKYRAAILTSACEGRLVPTEAALARAEGRTPLVGNALVRRCASARAESTAKKRQSRASLAPVRNSLPFSLPEGWAAASLGDVADIQGGITKGQQRTPDEVLRPVPYLRVANVQRGFLDLSEVKTIEATESEIEDLRLRRGDVLFNEGGDRDKLGRGWVWNGEIPECIHQNHVFRARPLVPGLQSKFLSWYGNSFGQRYFLEQGKQTTNLASINMTKLSALPVPIPPAPEQERIVAEVERLLSTVDAVEATVNANLKRAARLRAAVLSAAFDGTLGPQRSERDAA